MSTDYKIGIVVGLVVLIAGVVYFVVSGADEAPPPPSVAVPTSGPNEVVVQEERVSAETAPSTPATQITIPSDDQADGDAITPRLSETTETGWRLDETPGEKPPAASAPVETGELSFQLNADADLALNEEDPAPLLQPIERPAQRVDVALTGRSDQSGTYVVREGDAGFWIIAERVYGRGNGKYWTLIQKANPTADTNALRPNQKLIIPPLPEETVEIVQPTESRPEPGRVMSDSGGEKIYIVSKDDSAGLWGIAAKPEVYGKGYLWQHIARANPSVDPTRLREGMKLIIPPLPAASTSERTPRIRRREQQGQTLTENGRRYYIVQAGDKGYWGIAKKIYGDGKYTYLIDRANPGVESDTLQPGDKLLLPPKPEDTTGARRTRSASPIRSGEPDFGP